MREKRRRRDCRDLDRRPRTAPHHHRLQRSPRERRLLCRHHMLVAAPADGCLVRPNAAVTPSRSCGWPRRRPTAPRAPGRCQDQRRAASEAPPSRRTRPTAPCPTSRIRRVLLPEVERLRHVVAVHVEDDVVAVRPVPEEEHLARDAELTFRRLVVRAARRLQRLAVLSRDLGLSRLHRYDPADPVHVLRLSTSRPTEHRSVSHPPDARAITAPERALRIPCAWRVGGPGRVPHPGRMSPWHRPVLHRSCRWRPSSTPASPTCCTCCCGMTQAASASARRMANDPRSRRCWLISARRS